MHCTYTGFTLPTLGHIEQLFLKEIVSLNRVSKFFNRMKWMILNANFKCILKTN